MTLSPYLHFQGNCAAAMAFYADVFGGTLEVATYADAPVEMFPGEVVPEDAASRVMHSTLSFPGGTLMASDYPPGMEGEPQKSVSVAYTVGDIARGEALFDRLREGGHIVMPWGETFWTAGFGMLKDRFGTHWMISGPAKEMTAG